jgi:hypothetical protein
VALQLGAEERGGRGRSTVSAAGTDATISKPSERLARARAGRGGWRAAYCSRTQAGAASQSTTPSAISPASSSMRASGQENRRRGRDLGSPLCQLTR